MSPTFANGGIPLSAEGIQGQIRLARQKADAEAYPILKAAEPQLDQHTFDLCADERRQGNPMPDWLLAAELAAFNRCRAKAT